MTIDTHLWTKQPKYEEVVAAIEKDYKVKLPPRTAVTFWDSYALSQFRGMVAELQNSEQARVEHVQMEGAVQQAAEEQGLSRREMTSYMGHLAAQNSSAVETLQRQLNESHIAQRTALQEQGAAFATQLAQESQRADRREQAARMAMESLRETVPTSLPPPPAPATQAVTNIHNHHTQQIQASSPEQTEQMALLRQGQAAHGHAIGEMVRTLQGEGQM